MEILGYFASLVIGISLGLIGGGGSILTVPVLVYLFDVDPVIATAYSLFIVGSTSLVGVFPKYKNGEINVKTAIIFGIPSIIAVYATRAFIVHFQGPGKRVFYRFNRIGRTPGRLFVGWLNALYQTKTLASFS